jgi:hypothetical protein
MRKPEHKAEEGKNNLLQGTVMVWLKDASLELGLNELLVKQVQVVPLPPSACEDVHLLPLNICVPHHKPPPTQLLPSEARVSMETIRDGEQGGGPT